MTYGYKVKGDQDEIVALVRRVLHDTTQTTRQGAYLVDIIPQRMIHVNKAVF
jgi:hypothetical protein